jgi:proton-dependent oligopeptide transporter, POT family
MATRAVSDVAPAAGAAHGDKHPKGLYVLFATEMWERFSFYSMLALFTLYMQNPDEGFGWTPERTTRLYANYLMFVYASPLVGGWLADKKLGYRKAVMLGGFFFMAGHLLLSFRSLVAVYAALTCLVIGNGLFKPNVSTMVGNLYPEGSHLKDRAYNIFYMGINIGAFLAPVVMEIVKQNFGNHPAFAVAAFGMLISVGILWRYKRHVEDPPKNAILEEPPGDVAPTATDLPPQGVSQQTEGGPDRPATTPGGMFARDSQAARAGAMDAVPEWKRILALIVIFAIVIVFWMVFHQNGSTLTYWADDNTDWNVSGTISNAINPFWVVTLTFPLVFLWRWLDQRGKEPSTPAKMAVGMTLTGLSFFILYAGARAGETQAVNEGMYASGNFRLTDRSIGNLRAEGVPDDVLAALETKDEKGNFVVKGKKYGPENFEQSAERTLANLKTAGAPPNVLQRVEELKGYKGDQKFPEAVREAAGQLGSQGVSADVMRRLEQEGRTLSGQERLAADLRKHLGDARAAQHAPAVLRQSYLFRVSPLWLIIAYAVVTLGELMLSPMGLSLVSKVAPIRMRGLMMGGWFVATAIGNKLTMIGVYWDRWWQSSFFAVLGAAALVMAVVLVILLRPLKKAMPGV